MASTHSDGCGSDTFCPVHEGFSGASKPYPLGHSLTRHVDIRPIPNQTANQIHVAHHSYVYTPRKNSVVSHGVFVDDRIVGAISYAYLLASEPIAGYASDEYIELARVTIAVDMPNLASCGLSASQDQFAETYARDNDIGLLVTYVHEDYDGSMFKALQTKGWTYDGESRGHQAGNRPDTDIRDVDKSRWVCEI